MNRIRKIAKKLSSWVGPLVFTTALMMLHIFVGLDLKLITLIAFVVAVIMGLYFVHVGHRRRNAANPAPPNRVVEVLPEEEAGDMLLVDTDQLTKEELMEFAYFIYTKSARPRENFYKRLGLLLAVMAIVAVWALLTRDYMAYYGLVIFFLLLIYFVYPCVKIRLSKGTTPPLRYLFGESYLRVELIGTKTQIEIPYSNLQQVHDTPTAFYLHVQPENTLYILPKKQIPAGTQAEISRLLCTAVGPRFTLVA